MRFRRIVSAIVIASMLPCSLVTAKEYDKVDAVLRCKASDILNITVDNKNCKWASSNTDIVKVSDEDVVVSKVGECYLEDSLSGYKVRVVSKGVGNGSEVSVNYDSDASISDAVVEDNTKNIQTVEVNDTINGTVSDVPKGFQEGDGKLRAGAEGTYMLESNEGQSVVNVITPHLNFYQISGVTGQEYELKVVTEGIKTVNRDTSNKNVAVVDNKGVVKLTGEGTCDVFIDTPNNRLSCTVISRNPTVDESKVTLNGESTYQIEVKENYANLPVKYEIESGNGEVSGKGLVTMNPGDKCKVKITIWDKIVYHKEFESVAINEGYWEAMQPYIQECLGTPYVFGGTIPGVGLDCSAYVSYVYRNVGLVNGRYTAEGLWNMSEHIDDPQPGDMIFFKGTYKSGISHIGIYAGNGMMYHSGKPNQKASFETAYFKKHFAGFGTLIRGRGDLPNITNSKGVKASPSDIDLLAAIIQCEAGGSNYEGCLAVGSCVVNRMKSKLYPNTVAGVVYQKGQFAPVWEGKLKKVLAKGATKTSYRAAKDALAGKNNIGGCLQFRATYQTKHKGLNIGGNTFFDDRGGK